MINEKDKTNDQTKDSLVLTAFQTACFAIIVLNAKLIGDLFYNVSLLEKSSIQPPHIVLLILTSVLNFFELTNNWTSVKKYFKQYDGGLFLIDVATLGCFFWQVYVLSKWIDTLQTDIEFTENELEQRVNWIIIISYGLIFILYALWNYIILRNKNQLEENDRKDIRHSLIMRGIQACISLAILLFFMKRISIWWFYICIVACIICVVKHNRNLNIFETIIASKKQD